jgi:glycosyltransferase involved in cell wall biosynthesis
MGFSREKVILFMPAYFAAKTLTSVYKKIPKQYIDEIVLVDDGSSDDIDKVATSLGIRFFRNDRNLGYGGNIKVCLQKALELGGDIIIELHPDDQYNPSCIPAAIAKMREGYDFVMGSRFLIPGAAIANKMPFWKYAINRMSTWVVSSVLGLKLTEFHCGFRVYHRRFIESVYFEHNHDDYLFSFQIIAQAAALGVRIAELPVVCRYFSGATQISFKKTILYGWGVLKTLFIFMRTKWGKKHILFIPKEKIKMEAIIQDVC